FIVQIKTCGINATFGERIDGRNQPAGNLGGNRYGSNASCTATSQTTQSNEAVPIIRIAWRDVETQTLPAGFENTMANSSTTAPFNQPNDQRWQWHYDHAQFQATGPISITDISFRPNSPTAQPAAIDISSLEVVMIESSSSFEPASHPLTFSGSVLRQRVVRAGPFTNATLKPSSGGVSNWISLQLDKAFTYDPTSGHDFIVEVRACGINTPLGDNIDLASSSSTTAFGNRYGHTSNCTIDQINSFTFSNLVPVLKLDYVSVVKSPPYYESFDLAGSPGPAEWSQDDADSSQDWLYFNRSTPSANTGPLSDRTTRQEFDGFYAYIEDSGEENDPVVLVTPWFDLSGMTNPEFSFWYSSFDNLDVGISNNLLKVQRETMGSAPQTMFTIFPAANLDWRFMRFTLSGASGGMTRIIFSGETDNGGFSNDIAIDDFRVYDRQDLGGQPAGVNRSFDINEALDVNGIPVGFANQVNGPFFAEATLGESYRMRFRAMPNEAILLLGGTLSPAAQIFPQGVFDLSNSFVVVNGAGSGFLESVFRADFNGELDMDLTVPASIPAGTKFALQPINFVTGPQVIELANAV
ncbi:MAG: hypothetical protein KDB53_07065, partial [Planctomycetes bacterium]|nr:hypothetical protein [Planctomycetota bacterium]